MGGAVLKTTFRNSIILLFSYLINKIKKLHENRFKTIEINSVIESLKRSSIKNITKIMYCPKCICNNKTKTADEMILKLSQKIVKQKTKI